MNDLEQTIETWRNELTMRESIVQENIEELEDHLRMSMLQLTKLGLAEDEAFLIASKRIGAGSTLESEFRKVNAVTLWLQRLRWMIVGTLLFQALYGIWRIVIEVASESLLVFSKSPFLSGVLFILLSAFLPVGLWLGLKDVVQVNSVLRERLKIFSQPIHRGKGIFIGLIVIVFLLIPILRIYTFFSVEWDSVQIMAVFVLIAEFIVPALGILVLLWLERNYGHYSMPR